jgi:hypothetical protein
LREVLLAIEAADATASDHLKMIGAVHGALPNKLSSEGIATSVLSLLINPPSHMSVGNNQLVHKLCSLIRAIADELGASFDGCQLLQSLLEFDVASEKWTTADEENRARLMYQCVTLLVQSSRRGAVASDADILMLRNNLIRSRKLLLGWCCRDYAPLYRRSEKPANGRKKNQDEEIVGAGPADYNSILDGQGNSAVPLGLKVMRCLLFMEDSTSPVLKNFLSPGGSSLELETFWQEESKRIDQCCEHGTDLDDEMIWIVLQSTTPAAGDDMPSEVALALLEHLFEYCNGKRKSSLHLTDPQLIWELYKVVEYLPPLQAIATNSKSHLDSLVDSVDDREKDGRKRNGIHLDIADSQQDVPR